MSLMNLPTKQEITFILLNISLYYNSCCVFASPYFKAFGIKESRNQLQVCKKKISSRFFIKGLYMSIYINHSAYKILIFFLTNHNLMFENSTLHFYFLCYVSHKKITFDTMLTAFARYIAEQKRLKRDVRPAIR